MKLSKKFSYLPVLLSFCLAFLFTACEGFFTNNNVDEKIRAAIDYANAPTSSFFISADASAGTITPVGKISYKPTDYQNIKFKIKPEYEFIRWNFRYEEIQSGEKYTKQITNPDWWKDYIDIVSEEISEPASTGEITYTLQIQFKKPEENMLIEPVCALKPVLKSWSGQLGEIQSRNGSLSFVFNTKLDLDKSLYFSDAEIEECSKDTETGETVTVTPLFNGQNPSRVYGYEKNGERYFKNIEIKYKNRSINSSYCDFRWNNDTNTLIIASDPSHSFDIAGDFADIEVLFKDGIKSESQASMKEAKAVININKYSDELSIITVVTNTAKNPGTVNPVTQTLHLQETKTVTFTDSNINQFLYWEVTSNAAYPESKNKVYIEVDEDNPLKLNYWGMQKIDSAEEVTISAVYEPRPKIISYSPSAQSVVPKDSNIQINFSEEINLDSFKNGYRITCGGDPVNDYFETPVLSADKKSIIIVAKLDKRLLIDSNKQVTVTVPASVYYTKTESDGETYHITLGQETPLSYTIDTTTKDKAYVQFNINSNQVTIDNFNTANIKTYSIGETQTIVCNEKEGYQFLGWVKNNDAANAIEVIKVDEKTYTFKINNACGEQTAPIEINANVKERLYATLKSPLMDSAGVEKDNDIILDFNHRPSLEDCKDKISILYNNINLNESSFSKELWNDLEETSSNGKTVYRLTIPANPDERLEISGVANIEVRINDDLFYTDGQDNVYYKPNGDTFKYKINNSTKNKAYVQFNVTSGHGTVRSGVNTFNTTGVKVFNIGEEVTLTFEEADNYQFFDWTKTGDSAGKIQIIKSDINPKMYTLKFTDSIGTSDSPVNISAKTKERLRVNKITPQMETNGVEKDTSISIYFNHKPNLELCKQKIAINCMGLGNVKTDCFPVSGWNMSNTATSDGYCLTIPASTTNRINITSLSTVTVSFDANLYYVDGSDNVYYGGDGFTYDYKIKNETIDKAKLSFSSVSGQGTIIKGTNSDYSIGERIQIEFEPSADYEFLYWNVTGTNAQNVISFDDEDDNLKLKTYITVNAATTDSAGVSLSPVCAAKPKVTSYKINTTSYAASNSSASPAGTFAKDSSYTLILNNSNVGTYITNSNISNYVSIEYGSTPVKDSFNISISSSNINIEAKEDKRLKNISSDKNLKITVSKDLFYKSNNKDISMKEDFILTLKLSTETVQKTTVVLTPNTTDGTLQRINTSGTTNITTTSTINYSKDASFSLKFVPDSNYKFISWSVTGVSQNITLDNVKSLTPVITVEDAQTASGSTTDTTVTITPVCAAKPKVTSYKINSSSYTASNSSASPSGTFAKDSSYTLILNDSNVGTYITNSNISNYISIEYGSTPVKDFYNISISSANINIEAKADKRLQNISDDKNLKITVSKDLFYESNDEVITMKEDFILTLKLSADTVKKTTVNLTPNTTYGTLQRIDSSGTTNITATSSLSYSKDASFSLKFVPASNYEFVCWSVTGVSQNISLTSYTSLTPVISVVDTQTAQGSTTNTTVTITPVCVEKLQVSSIKVNNSTFNPSTTYTKDSTITVTFNKSLGDVGQFVHLNYLGQDVGTGNYFTLSHDDDTTTFTFTPVDGEFISVNDTGALVLTVDKDIYYNYSTTANGTTYTKVLTLDSNYTSSINVDYKSKNKFKISTQLSIAEAGVISISPQPADGYYYLGQEIQLTCEVDEFYKLNSWSFPGTGTSLAYRYSYVVPGKYDKLKIKFTKATNNTTISNLQANVSRRLLVTSISPTPAKYYSNITPTPSGSVPCDTPIVIEYNDKVKVTTSSSNDTSTSSTILSKIFSDFYCINLGEEKVDLKNYYVLQSVSYTTAPTYDNTSPRYANNSSKFILKPKANITDIFDDGYEQYVYIKFNTSCTSTDNAAYDGFSSDNIIYKNKNPLNSSEYDIRITLNNSIQNTSPTIISSSVRCKGPGTESPHNIQATEKVKLGVYQYFFDDYPQNVVYNSTGNNGTIYYEFVVNGAGNWNTDNSNFFNIYEIELIKYASDTSGAWYPTMINPRLINSTDQVYRVQTADGKGKIKGEIYLGTGKIKIITYSRVIESGTTKIKQESNTIDLGTAFNQGDFIEINFKFHDINGGITTKTYTVFYDKNNEYADTWEDYWNEHPGL